MEIEIRQKQEQTISPQMAQTMEILPLNSMELREYLENAAMENPVIELEKPAPPDSTPFREILWLEKENRRSMRQEDYAADADYVDPIENRGDSTVREESLELVLKEQLFSMKAPRKVEQAAAWIISNLDEHGWYERDEGSEPFDSEAGDGALRLIRSMEPAGVGARDLRDCLLLQLERMEEDTSLPRMIVSEHLEDMAKSHFNHIAAELNISQKKVREACEKIRALNPRPAASFARHDRTEYIRPDAVIYTESGKTKVSLAEYELPTPHLSQFYCELARQTDSPQVEEYLKGKIKQVYLLQQSLKQRRSTIINCLEIIGEIQQDFLQQGGELLPMSLRDVAERAGIHESTVSRAMHGKYIQCPRGVFPVKSLFSRAIHGGRDSLSSAKNIKERILRMVEDEDKQNPMSDQQISDELKGMGADISRRTVAKYRAEMSIPPATGRKR